MSVSLISTAAKSIQNESGNGNGNKSSNDDKITALPHSANEMNVTVTPIKSQSSKAELPEPEVSRAYAETSGNAQATKDAHCKICHVIFISILYTGNKTVYLSIVEGAQHQRERTLVKFSSNGSAAKAGAQPKRERSESRSASCQNKKFP